MNVTKEAYQQILSALDHYGPVTAVRHLREPDSIVAMRAVCKDVLKVKDIAALQELHLSTGYSFSLEPRRLGILITIYMCDH